MAQSGLSLSLASLFSGTRDRQRKGLTDFFFFRVLDSVAVVCGCSCFFLCFACSSPLTSVHPMCQYACYISLLFDVAVFWLLFIICANKLATFSTAFLHYDGCVSEIIQYYYIRMASIICPNHDSIMLQFITSDMNHLSLFINLCNIRTQAICEIKTKLFT